CGVRSHHGHISALVAWNAGPLLRIGAGESRSQVMSNANRDLYTLRRMLQVSSLGAGAAIVGLSGKRLGAFAQSTPETSPDASVFDHAACYTPLNCVSTVHTARV